MRFARAMTICLTTLLCAAALLEAQAVRLRPRASLYLDALGAGMRTPEAVDFDGESLVVVADSGNRRLLLFELGEDAAEPLGEIRLAQLTYPIRVRIDSRGDLLALDGKTSKIVRASRGGEFRGFVEAPVEDRQQQAVVRSFDLDDQDNVYVLEISAGEVIVLTPEGDLTRRISIPPEVGFLSDLTVSSTGVVFAIDTVRKQVYSAGLVDEALSPLTATMEEDMAFPTSIATDTFGHLFIGDKSGGGIVIVGQNGAYEGRQAAMGWREGFLRYPSDLAISGDSLFVADRGNNRIQRFEILR